MNNRLLTYRSKVLSTLCFIVVFLSQSFQAQGHHRHAIARLDIEIPDIIWVNAYTARIPFQFIGRLPAVEVIVWGQKGKFLFDTGSADLILNSGHYLHRTADQPLASVGSTGSVKIMEYRRIDSLLVDEVLMKNIRASIIDLSHLEESKKSKILGILGFTVFKDFEVFIDYPYRQIILTRLNKQGNRYHRVGIPELPADSMRFRLHKHAIILNGSVRGIPLKLNLDTGAEVNLLNSNIDHTILESFRIIRRAVLLGVGQRKVEVLAGKLDDLECGAGQTYPMRTLLTSTDYIRDVVDARVDGVLGYEYLYTKRISINYKRKKIYFYKHAILKP